MSLLLRAACVTALLAGSAVALPADTASKSASDAAGRDRQRIAEARKAAEAQFALREHECATRFVVTSCVEDAKRERREALARLRTEEHQLDDELRKSRAAARREAMNDRAIAEAQRKRDVVVEPPRRMAPGVASTSRAQGKEKSAARESNAPSGGSAGRSHRTSPPPAVGEREPDQEQKRARFAEAQRAAEAHRADVEKRTAEHAAKRKPGAPLPVPAELER